MNRSLAPLSLAPLVASVGGLILLVAGCALPGVGKSEPGGPATASEPSASSASVASSQPSTATPASSEMAATTAGPGSVSPVGYQHHGQACGCCPPQRPHGYAAPPATFNWYGVDPQEFLCDGGDWPPEATLRRNDSIAGLQPEDTVTHYTTEAGDIEFQASNRVCLYAPRFASVRKITGAVAGQRAVGVVGVDRPVGPNRLEFNQPGLVLAETTGPAHSEAARRIDAMRERNRGVPVDNVLQPVQTADVLAALAGLTVLELEQLRDDQLALVRRAAVAAVTWNTDLSVEVAYSELKPPVLTRDQTVEGVTVYDFPDAGRLRILKFADRSHAQPGERVNFMIRVENVGDSAVDEVVITDNLTTRLEYVEGSQQTDVPADFAAKPNEAQSSQLIWTLQEALPVGETVTIEFACLVR